MSDTKQDTKFSGSLGFVLSAAGSAVGLGNLWRFPYLAAQNGGGLFLVTYIVLAMTFGFTLLISEVAIGRKTKCSPLSAYGRLSSKFKWIGCLAVLVPFLILPYYSTIGGWVLKYALIYLTGKGRQAASPTYFTDYIQETAEPIFLMAVFIFITSFVIYRGINKGIERLSSILMPLLVLVVMGISIYVLTISYKDGSTTRTGLDGLKIYLIPDIRGLTIQQFFKVMMDAIGQLFYSISVAMGIMITFGSYFEDKDNMITSVSQIEIFDTAVAFLAGVMIIIPIYVIMGRDGMNASGPSLLFISIPAVFNRMNSVGDLLGASFFVMVFFAALTSSVSIMEAVVSSMIEQFRLSRKLATIFVGFVTFIIGTFVCLGYNHLYVELPLPNGSTGQILDVLDFISNSFMMPIVAIATCILIGWVTKPEAVIEEATKNGERFGRKKLYIVMVKVGVPFLLTILLLQSLDVAARIQALAQRLLGVVKFFSTLL